MRRKRYSSCRQPLYKCNGRCRDSRRHHRRKSQRSDHWQLQNYGNVSSSDGYAAGIAATNEGTIRDCVVSGGSGTGGIKIHSLGEKEIGAVCAINSGTVSGSYPEGNVTLQGDASIFGGVTGRNTGTVAVITLTSMPVIDATKSN